MFDWINIILKYVLEANLLIKMYSFFNNVALVVAAVFFFLYARRFRIHWFKSLICITLLYYWIVYAAQFALWVESGFLGGKGPNFAMGFVYAPLCCWLLAKVFRLPYKTICDWLAPMPLLLVAIFRIGCTFAGCCKGYPADWGIFNPYTKDYRIPVQLIETLLSMIIFAFLLVRMRMRKFVPDGKGMYWMLLLYGAARFLVEFLRENEKLVYGVSAAAFHAIFMCIVGAVCLLFTRREKGLENNNESSRVNYC